MAKTPAKKAPKKAGGRPAKKATKAAAKSAGKTATRAAKAPAKAPSRPSARAKKEAIRTKRAYARPSRSDGMRILVDHIWPRGLTKETLAVDDWIKAIAPSDQLRKWFNHIPERWEQFQRRYSAELNMHPELWQEIARAARKGPVTLVYAAADTKHNNAVALKNFLDRHSRG